MKDWFDPRLWKEPELARRLRRTWPSGRYNLYHDLCRACHEGTFDGSIEQLCAIAAGNQRIERIGPAKIKALNDWLTEETVKWLISG